MTLRCLFSPEKPLLRLLLCCVLFLGITVNSRPTVEPEHDMPPEQEIWLWPGGEQLDPADFAFMVGEVLDVMPVIPAREDLVLLLSETVATESSFGYAVADKSGKTLGVYQILHTTAQFVLKRLEEEHPNVHAVVTAYMYSPYDLRDNLMHNLQFQTAMAAAYYWMRASDALNGPPMDINERARLYKEQWNTRKGRATEAKYIRDSQRYLVSGW